jgi:hypothetical protein
MTAHELIERIQMAKRLEDVVAMPDWRTDYKKLLLIIHPDVCSLSGASLATSKLNALKDKFEKGETFSDESGNFRSNGFTTVFEGDVQLLKTSFQHYHHLKSAGSLHFRKYLPSEMYWEDRKLVVHSAHRSIPLSHLQLPQEHVNWILSRMLEFTVLLWSLGYTHCGLTPESVWVVPETHGIQVSSFYHMTPLGKKVTSINAHYSGWYPPYLFTDKIAKPYIDIELSKKNAISLLGDPSGSGIRLKKTHLPAFIEFVTVPSYDPVTTYEQYRALLKMHFKKKFHVLNL